MKCKRCRRAEAAVELPSHHAAFCPDCFFVFFRRQVTEGIRKLRLLSPEDRVLVCVSGGKVSLVVNEVSYPSHLERNASVCCSFARLIDVYASRSYRLVSGDGVLAEAMADAGLVGPHAAAFLTAADFETMQHAQDDVYDSQLWQWNPANPHKYEHRSTHTRYAAI